MAHPTWPLFDLVIRTPRMELRLATDDELAVLLPQADKSIYDGLGYLPFHVRWPEGPMADKIQFHWAQRANFKPDNWNLLLTPFVDGEPLGCQGMSGIDFGVMRSVESGSWLLKKAQRQGLGTEMRAAALHLAFEGLGALEAHSEAHVDNKGSNGVSRALGYVETHVAGARFGDERGLSTKLFLTRDGWLEHRRDDFEIDGLDACLEMFGVGEKPPVQVGQQT